MKKVYIPVTPELFKEAKKLTSVRNQKGDYAVEAPQAASIIGVSESTIYRIRVAKDYTDYKERNKEDNRRSTAYKERVKLQAEQLEKAKASTELVLPEDQPKPIPKPIDATSMALKQLVTEVQELRREVKETKSVLDWVAENAIIETVKKRRFFGGNN